jgi:hypothetical protein
MVQMVQQSGHSLTHTHTHREIFPYIEAEALCSFALYSDGD